MITTVCSCESTNQMELCEACNTEFEVLLEESPIWKNKTAKQTAATSAVADQAQIDSFRAFHEEFKRLAATPAELARGEKYNPYHRYANSETTVVPTFVPQQKVKVIEGPPLGTPPAATPWLLKIIGVLIVLNMVFAGLVVSGVRINEWFKWIQM